MAVYRRGKIWWYEFVFMGRRIRESSFSRSKEIAIKAERERRRRLEEAANGLQPKRRPIQFEIAVAEWMEQQKASWSEAYAAIHSYNLKHLSPFFTSMFLQEIDTSEIGRYQSTRKYAGASNRTINMEVSTLRMIMGSFDLWAPIARKVKMLHEKADVGKALEQEEVSRVLEACRNSSQPCLYTVVVIFANTGLRNEELRTARWWQVDFSRAQFDVSKSKTPTGTSRIVQLNWMALEALRTWKAEWPKASSPDYIFPSQKLVYKGRGAATAGRMTPYATDLGKPIGSWKTAWKTAQKVAGVKCRIHDLRHYFITVLGETNAPEQAIKSLAGHVNPKMLERYSHPRSAAKRKAVDAVAEVISGQESKMGD